MDYEKILKEALNNKSLPFEVTSWIEEQFPQLAESEGEKMRKRIILCLEECVHNDIIRDYEKEQCLAWLEKQGEQKPWSEEDETIKNNISHIIRQYDKISKRENQPCCYVGDCLLWMQNIKDRVQPQPKQEWSEEDECNVINICAHLRSVLTNETVEKYRNWFEILRQKLSNVERNGKNWKPSKEQIRVVARLRHCLLEDVRGNDVVILDNLLEQLKEL